MQEKIFILKFGRCNWSRCLFCGYGTIPGRRPRQADIEKEFDSFFASLQGEEHVKVFGSGSFLDEKQIPSEARKYFIEKCKASGIKKLTIESRPEFIEPGKIREFGGMQLEVAIGLEAADDDVLDRIKKGFHLEDFERAAEILHAEGVLVRAYLLVNPPFVEDAQREIDQSVEYALKFSDTIVLINLLPHHASRLMRMWVRGEWSYLSKNEFNAVVGKWEQDPRIDVDSETFHFTPKFPKEMQENLKGVGEEYLTHPHFDVWQDYLTRWYARPEKKKTVLFLPCAYKKPYSESSTHRKIIEKLEELNIRADVHEVMLSNAGVIPREFEDNYPFNSYDWDEKLETEEIKKRYVEVTAERIEAYLAAQKYDKVRCYLKYSAESYQALKEACEKLGLGFKNLLSRETYESIKEEKRPLQTDAALSDLYAGLKDEDIKV